MSAGARFCVTAQVPGDLCGDTNRRAGATRAPPASASIGPFHGRDAVVKALTGGAAGAILDVSTIKREVRSVIVDGDRAAVQQRVTATARNGNDYANEYCWVYTCRDGQVQLLEEYADTLYAGRVFGFVKD